MVKIKSSQINYEFLTSVSEKEIIIRHNGEDFYFKFNIKENIDKLVVHTNGAIDYKVKLPPLYQRSSWGDEIEASCIFIDDRTLHGVEDENFNTGWLMGSRDRYYAEDYSEIVRIIQQSLNIESKRVFYWGSSAGGTAAIALATLHPDSTAIANNPQTNILKDYDRRKHALLKNVFSGMKEENVIKHHYHRLTLVGLMKHQNYVPRLYYIQNNKHRPDIVRHYRPFIEELEQLEINIDSITFWLYHDEERGHGPLNKPKSLEYLHTIMNLRYL